MKRNRDGADWSRMNKEEQRGRGRNHEEEQRRSRLGGAEDEATRRHRALLGRKSPTLATALLHACECFGKDSGWGSSIDGKQKKKVFQGNITSAFG
jgi:hypothetical protein